MGGELTAEKYRDIAQLGTGGMGEVYLSVAQGSFGFVGFNKLLVVKRIRQSFAEDPDVLAMFLNEARLAARLNHANVVQTNEVGFDGKRHFIAMEYLDGQSLVSVLRRAHATHRRLPLAMHLRVLTEALNGLHYAHELADFDGTPLSIVHRDATPHNVFITYDGQIKIVDFGIAKAGQTGDTRTGEFKGKVPYMAPEQVMQTQIDRRVDLYAVGVMLWEAITGVRMWKGVSDVQIMMRLHNDERPNVTDLAPDAAPALVAIVNKALARQPDDRYATAAEFQTALEDFLPTLGAPATARDVGLWVGEHFAEDRKRIRAAIDKQLKKLKDEPAAVLSVPPLELGTSIGSGSDPGSDTPQRMELTPSNLQAASISAGHLPPRRSRYGTFGVVAAVGVGVGLIALVMATRKPSSSATNAPVARPSELSAPARGSKTDLPAGTPASASSAIASSETVDVVRLHLKISPANATVMVDDGVLATLDARYAKDGLSHRIRVESPGFLPKSQWVLFDGKPIDLEVKLDKISSYATGPKAPSTLDAAPKTGATTNDVPIAQSTTATADPEKKPAKPPKSSIDMSDPYK